MAEYELKPCPFCGDNPHLDRHDIFCDCGAKIEMPIFVVTKESVDDYPNYREARQQMIEAWNTRANEKADVVEVVRCKDCIHSKESPMRIICQRYGRDVNEDGYCSYGERREE